MQENEKLRLARLRKHLTQFDLIKATKGAITQHSLSMFENGHKELDDNTIKKIKVALELPE